LPKTSSTNNGSTVLPPTKLNESCNTGDNSLYDSYGAQSAPAQESTLSDDAPDSNPPPSTRLVEFVRDPISNNVLSHDLDQSADFNNLLNGMIDSSSPSIPVNFDDLSINWASTVALPNEHSHSLDADMFERCNGTLPNNGQASPGGLSESDDSMNEEPLTRADSPSSLVTSADTDVAVTKQVKDCVSSLRPTVAESVNPHNDIPCNGENLPSLDTPVVSGPSQYDSDDNDLVSQTFSVQSEIVGESIDRLTNSCVPPSVMDSPVSDCSVQTGVSVDSISSGAVTLLFDESEPLSGARREGDVLSGTSTTVKGDTLSGPNTTLEGDTLSNTSATLEAEPLSCTNSKVEGEPLNNTRAKLEGDTLSTTTTQESYPLSNTNVTLSVLTDSHPSLVEPPSSSFTLPLPGDESESSLAPSTQSPQVGVDEILHTVTTSVGDIPVTQNCLPLNTFTNTNVDDENEINVVVDQEPMEQDVSPHELDAPASGSDAASPELDAARDTSVSATRSLEQESVSTCCSKSGEVTVTLTRCEVSYKKSNQDVTNDDEPSSKRARLGDDDDVSASKQKNDIAADNKGVELPEESEQNASVDEAMLIQIPWITPGERFYAYECLKRGSDILKQLQRTIKQSRREPQRTYRCGVPGPTLWPMLTQECMESDAELCEYHDLFSDKFEQFNSRYAIYSQRNEVAPTDLHISNFMIYAVAYATLTGREALETSVKSTLTGIMNSLVTPSNSDPASRQSNDGTAIGRPSSEAMRLTPRKSLGQDVPKSPGSKQFTCDLCPFRGSKVRLVTHKSKMHSAAQPFVCYICFKSLKNIRTMAHHFRKGHPEIKVERVRKVGALYSCYKLYLTLTWL